MFTKENVKKFVKETAKSFGRECVDTVRCIITPHNPFKPIARIIHDIVYNITVDIENARYVEDPDTSKQDAIDFDRWYNEIYLSKDYKVSYISTKQN